MVVALGQGQFQRIQQRQVQLGIDRLGVAADVAQDVAVVEWRQVDAVERIVGVALAWLVATEVVFLAAQVDAGGQLHFAAGQVEAQPAGDAGVDAGHDRLAAVQVGAIGRGIGQRGHRFRRLRLARQQERIEQATAQHLAQLGGVVVTAAQGGGGFARRPRDAGVVVPAADLALEAQQDAVGLGVGGDLALAARDAAPAVGDRRTIVQLAGAEVRGQRVVDLVVGRTGAGVERAGIEDGAGRDLVGLEGLLHVHFRPGEFHEHPVPVGNPEGRPADDVLAFHRLLHHRRGRIVVGARIARTGHAPQHVVVGSHQAVAAAAFAAGRAGQVERVDVLLGRAVGRIDQAVADQGRRAGGPAGDGRIRGAAGIGRQAALGLEGVGEIAVIAAQDLALPVAETGKGIPAIGVQVATADQQVAAMDVAAAFLGGVGERRQFQAPVIAAGDEVDHPADGVGAVDRRGTIAQHFHPLDGGEGNGVEVDHAALEPVRGHAAAVEQHQRGIGALAAQVGAGHAVVAALVHAGDDAHVAGQVVRAVAGDVEVAHQLFGRTDALRVDLGLPDDRDRQRGLDVGALDARAGDADLVQLLGRRLRGLGDGLGRGLREGDQRRAQPGQQRQGECATAGQAGNFNGHGHSLLGRWVDT